MEILVSIVIPVFNNWNFTKACLKDLSKLPDNHEIIVVDNGSYDETQKMLSSAENLKTISVHKNFKYIRNNSNLYFAKACNIGFINSLGKYVLFLNNDIRVKSNHSDWTKSLILEAVDGSIVGPNGGILDFEFNFIKETTKIMEGNFYMSGWCLMAEKNVWNTLIPQHDCGPFSSEFGIYFEDTDLGFRARRQKIKMKIVKIPVVHFGQMTSKKLGVNALYSAAKKIFIEKWKR